MTTPTLIIILILILLVGALVFLWFRSLAAARMREEELGSRLASLELQAKLGDQASRELEAVKADRDRAQTKGAEAELRAGIALSSQQEQQKAKDDAARQASHALREAETRLDAARTERDRLTEALAMAQEQARQTDAAKTEAQSAKKNRDEALAAKAQADSALATAQAQAAAESAKATELSQRLSAAESKSSQLQTNLDSARKTIGELEAVIGKQNTEANERQKSFDAIAAERQKQSEEFQAKLDGHLRALTQQLYAEQGKAMLGEGRQQLEQTLTPFKEKLNELQNRINEVHATDLKDRSSLETTLKNELAQVLKAQSQLSNDAQHLSHALTVNTKTQGNWGEITLERLFEESGLQKGIDYQMQVHVETEEDRRRPDALIFLPGKKAMVIDAKVSLTAFVGAMKADPGPEQVQLLKDHLGSVRKHIKDLSDRHYPELVKESLREHTLDFTLLFMPSEAAFAAAVTQEAELWSEAFKRKIIIVGPTTLLATLRVVEQIWRVERHNQNTDQIVELAADIVKKLASSLDDFDSVENKLVTAHESFIKARNRLVSGKGNIASKAKLMISLGVRTDAPALERLGKANEEEADGDAARQG